jgi:hypothetical protein
VTIYRERLTAPLSWWIAAAVFAAVWGWVFLVVTTWPIAIAATAVVALGGFVAVSRYGAVLIEVGEEGLRVGRASLTSSAIGAVEPLHRSDYHRRLGTDADARAYLVTRPYLDRGVLVAVDDDSDPVPYWLVSSRQPDEFAAALGWTAPQTGNAPAVHDTNGESSRGEEV